MKPRLLWFLCLLPFELFAQQDDNNASSLKDYANKDEVNKYGEANTYQKELRDPTFENTLIKLLGLYRQKIGVNNPDSATRRISKPIRAELTRIKEALAIYNQTTGAIPATSFIGSFLPKKTTKKVDRSTEPDSTSQLPARVGGSATEPVRTRAGWIFYKKGNLSKNDTCLTYAFSADSSLIAFATATKLTLKRVKTDAVIAELTEIASPAYSFSAKKALYVIDQLKLNELNQIDTLGKSTRTPLPDTLARFGYRIDQIRPDDSLVVFRRIQKGQTIISGWDFRRKQSWFLFSRNYPFSACRIEHTSADAWLLAAFQPDVQGYLLLLSPRRLGSFTELIPKPGLIPKQVVSDYQFDKRGNVVALLADSSLVTANIQSSRPHDIRTIADNARYFDWRGDTVVYWKRRDAKDPEKWGLYVYPLGPTANSTDNPRLGFWYDTDRQRDVPRITLLGKEVYFENRFNNTANWVKTTRLPLK